MCTDLRLGYHNYKNLHRKKGVLKSVPSVIANCCPDFEKVAIMGHTFLTALSYCWSERSACASGRSGHSTWHFFSSLSLSEVVAFLTERRQLGF